MTVVESLRCLRATIDEIEEALGFDPRDRTPTPKRLAEAVWADAVAEGRVLKSPTDCLLAPPKRKRGRPKKFIGFGSLPAPVLKPKRGRPKGSKNKPKEG